MKVKVKSLSRIRLLATPWTAAYQAPPSMGFSGEEYWSGVPLPSLSEIWDIPVIKQFSDMKSEVKEVAMSKVKVFNLTLHTKYLTIRVLGSLCLASAFLAGPPVLYTGLPGWLRWWRIHLQCRRPGFDPWLGKIPRRRDRLTTPGFLGFSGGSDGEESTCNAGDLGLVSGWGVALEKGVATHSRILAWRIPGHKSLAGWATNTSTVFTQVKPLCRA